MDWINLEHDKPKIGQYVWAKNGITGSNLLGYVMAGSHGLQLNTLQGIKYFTHWSTYEVIY